MTDSDVNRKLPVLTLTKLLFLKVVYLESSEDNKTIIIASTRRSTKQVPTDTRVASDNATEMSEAKRTTDRETIRKWVEDRGGRPTRVKGTGRDGSLGILRIDYPGYTGEDTLDELTWDEFFAAFEKNDLEFLYEDAEDSRFSKFVSGSDKEGKGKAA